MRIALGGIFHETNTFSSMVTTRREFENHAFVKGEEIINIYKGTQGSIGGVIDAANEYGLNIVPTIYAGAIPGGLVDDHIFEEIVDELCSSLDQELDGILLVLHGAMVTDKKDDAEAYILKKVRDKIGDNTPIVCTTDLHANISPEMVKFSSSLVGFDTYPHHDYYERAYDAVRIIKQIIKKEIVPVNSLKKPPIMPVVQKMLTEQHPMQTIMNLVHEMEEQPDVVNITLAGGFPYADIPWAGMGVLVTTNSDYELADSLSTELKQAIWSIRNDFKFENNSVSEGIAIAAQSEDHPFVIVDSSDNVGGGSSGDGTDVLRELIKAELKSCAVIIKDSEAVQQAEKAGAGETVELKVGGKTDNQHGSPVLLKGTVEKLSDGIYNSERTGERINMGRTAVLEVNGITLVITRDRVPAFDLETLRSLGIEPLELKYIVVKGAVQWKHSYGSIASGWVEVDSAGVTSSNLDRFNFYKIRRPIFPLDNI